MTQYNQTYFQKGEERTQDARFLSIWPRSISFYINATETHAFLEHKGSIDIKEID